MAWSWVEWLTLAGIIVAVGSGFALPFGVWMSRMWSGQRTLAIHLRYLRARVRRLERYRSEAVTLLNNQVSHVTSSVNNQIGQMSDRVNEHAEHIADHGARIANNEAAIKELKQHK